MNGKGDKRRPTDDKRFSANYDRAFGKKDPMPQTAEGYSKLAARDLELIMEQRGEIRALKRKVNDLQQKAGRGAYIPVRHLKREKAA
jgi:hypothetical protein